MAGLISPATLEQIRAASDIVDIIGGYIPLKRAGANFTALCPFHKEKSPSFNVNPHKQIFHCFGCHKGGDVFTFVKDYENIGFLDAVRRLAERAKIPLEFDQNPAVQESRHLKDQLLQIHEQIAQRWQNCLANEAAGQLARDYLMKRGVGEDAIKLFRIGAAPETWDDTVNWAKSKGHPIELVEKAGLVIRKEETGNYYDRFRGRLMFPICDEQGRVIGFSGRVLSGDEKTAKYVNSPETAIFTKSKVFFGLDKSKRAILDAGFAIVCEGQLDLIACFMGGVQNIIAPQGTAFTEQHARILKRYVDEVVLCFDSDNAGQNAAVRALDSLLASGLAVRVAVVPAPHDPDSFIKEHGGMAFKNLINEAEDFFDFHLKRLCQQNDWATDKGKVAIMQGMANELAKTGNTVLIDKYEQRTAIQLGVNPVSVRTEFKKILARASTPPSSAAEEEKTNKEVEAVQPSNQEFSLLKLLLQTDDCVAWAASNFDPNWIENESIRKIVALRLSAHSNRTWKSIPLFLSEADDDNTAPLVTEALTRPLITNIDGLKSRRETMLPNPEQQMFALASTFRSNFIDRELTITIQQLAQPGLADADKLALLQRQAELRQLKRQPLAANAR